MTISWGSVWLFLWGKKYCLCFLSVIPRYMPKELIDAGDFFSLNFVSDQYRDALNYCGSHCGRNEDKNCTNEATVDLSMESPYIDEGNLDFGLWKVCLLEIRIDSFLDSEICWPNELNGDMHHVTLDRSLMCSQDDHFC